MSKPKKPKARSNDAGKHLGDVPIPPFTDVLTSFENRIKTNPKGSGVVSKYPCYHKIIDLNKSELKQVWDHISAHFQSGGTEWLDILSPSQNKELKSPNEFIFVDYTKHTSDLKVTIRTPKSMGSPESIIFHLLSDFSTQCYSIFSKAAIKEVKIVKAELKEAKKKEKHLQQVCEQMPLVSTSPREQLPEHINVSKYVAVSFMIFSKRKALEMSKDSLDMRLDKGVTVREYINRAGEWYDNLNLEKTDAIVKLFNIFHSGKKTAIVNRELGIKTFMYPMSLDSRFYSSFMDTDEYRLKKYKTKEGEERSARVQPNYNKKRILKMLTELSGQQVAVPIDFHHRVLPIFQIIQTSNRAVSKNARIFAVPEPFLDSSFPNYHLPTTLGWEVKAAIEAIKSESIEEKLDYTKYIIRSGKVDLMERFDAVPLKLALLLIVTYSRNDVILPNGLLSVTSPLISNDLLNSECGDIRKKIRDVNKKYVNQRIKDEAPQTEWEHDLEAYILEFSFQVLRDIGYLIGNPKLDKNDNWRFILNQAKFDKEHLKVRLKSFKNIS